MSGRRPARQAPTMARRSLSFVPPPLALWAALWAAVGQGLLGQRPRQAGSPLRPPGPVRLGTPRSLLPISQSKWRPQTPVPSFSSQSSDACLLLGQSTRSDPDFISQAPLWSVTSHRPSLSSPRLATPFPSSAAATTVQIPVIPHLRGCSRLPIRPCFGPLCPSPCCVRCQTELSTAVLGRPHVPSLKSS